MNSRAESRHYHADAGVTRWNFAESMRDEANISVVDRAAGFAEPCRVADPPAMYCRVCEAPLSQYNSISRSRGICAACDPKPRTPLATMPKPSETITVLHAAARLGLTVEQVRDLMRAKKLQTSKEHSNRQHVTIESLDRFLQTERE